ncbi:hypothetical protein [Allobranchiibius sp. CTAmp26]|uniref:hypothetical protein n=1 Tax=Allobranchiibius sp. CTAmp26 TaxID=2815214 RepID=UPI001AA1ADD3|nr:hypothetical protein [Allobranchiibius sp. CTAmp26]MBO1754899.1 hypothetical protein [Allobranchiibius sp. CTAmp26]
MTVVVAVLVVVVVDVSVVVDGDPVTVVVDVEGDPVTVDALAWLVTVVVDVGFEVLLDEVAECSRNPTTPPTTSASAMAEVSTPPLMPDRPWLGGG